MADNFNPTEEQITQFYLEYGDDDGKVDDPELLASFMAGDIELSDTTDGDTAGEEQDAADTPEEASQASDDGHDENVANSDESGAEAADQEDKDPADKKEPVVLAKDGQNTIPYSVLEDLRKDLEGLKAQNEELKTLLETQPDLADQVADAAAADQEAGNTNATDLLLESLDENLEEDYPGITEKLKAQLLAPLQAKLDKIDELIADKAERDTRSQAEKAQDEYNEAVQALEPRYVTAINEDREAFWKWFDEQPSIIRAAETSGEPQHFADAVKTFYDQHPQSDEKEAPAEKREPKVDAKDVKASVDKAKKAAGDKSSVPSLSAIPGGKNPEHDENAAILNMTPMELAEKLEGKTPEQVEAYMARVL